MTSTLVDTFNTLPEVSEGTRENLKKRPAVSGLKEVQLRETGMAFHDKLDGFCSQISVSGNMGNQVPW